MAATVAGPPLTATIAQYDKTLLGYCATWGAELPFLLIAEGLPGGSRAFPGGASASHAGLGLERHGDAGERSHR